MVEARPTTTDASRHHPFLKPKGVPGPSGLDFLARIDDASVWAQAAKRKLSAETAAVNLPSSKAVREGPYTAAEDRQILLFLKRWSNYKKAKGYKLWRDQLVVDARGRDERRLPNRTEKSLMKRSRLLAGKSMDELKRLLGEEDEVVTFIDLFRKFFDK